MEIMEINNSRGAKTFLGEMENSLAKYSSDYTDRLEELKEEWTVEFNELETEIGYRDVYKMSQHKKNKVISLYFLIKEINKLIEKRNLKQHNQENKQQLDSDWTNITDAADYDRYLQRLWEEPGLTNPDDEYFPTEPE